MYRHTDLEVVNCAKMVLSELHTYYQRLLFFSHVPKRPTTQKNPQFYHQDRLTLKLDPFLRTNSHSASTIQSGRDLQQYQSQAKQLFRKLNEQSPTRCTLEAGAMAFHYIIEKGVCYLVLCEATFPKKLAFAYLEDLHSEFDEQHGKKVPTVSRPYSFIEFDTYIQKTKKLYIDSRARRNLGSINTELQDVQRIMVANIEEVLQRGEALSALDSKANNLSSLSKKYRQDAKYLNMRSTYAKLAAVAVFFIMLIVYVRFWWL
ncbi:PREDICTED: vesicle-trafficking protein SEC22b [Crocodylus porosus]|uniref:vesicle-trafficking protein SEC22b n=1 Tax=Crocodylus porosus TaxID=8502 RepID=UPI00093EB2B8|nr:PREDICTED: vesicle-trafficking protein SEC22b [Crocodylus porosus]